MLTPANVNRRHEWLLTYDVFTDGWYVDDKGLQRLKELGHD